MPSGYFTEIKIGDRYERLVIVSEVKQDPRTGPLKRRVVCICDCGKQIDVLLASIRNGNTKSCGCLQRETVSRLATGKSPKNKTHGMARTPEHKIWYAMRRRCTSPNASNWKYYGGRGITFDPRWSKFENFYADVGPRPSQFHSLDRINPNGNYEKSNCRWADQETQSRNKRCTCGCEHCCKTKKETS